MVLSIGELEKRSLDGGLYIPNQEQIDELADFIAHMCSSRSDSGCTTDSLVPDSSQISRTFRGMLKRDSIYSMRRKFSQSQGDCWRRGLLPDIRERYENPIPETFIYMEPRPEEGQVGTAGFDLRVGNFIAWSDELFRWGDRAFVNELELNGCKKDNYKYLKYGEEFVLEPDPKGNRFYYITSYEGIFFSDNLEIAVDSKSTTGRVGAFTHQGGFTDEGKFVFVIQPHSFSLKVRCGKTRLSQVAVRYRGSPYMFKDDILGCNDIKFEGDNVNLENSLGPRGLQMKFDTRLAYKAIKCDEPIDMDAVGILDWRKYFELIEGDHEIAADKETLYLLGSLGVIDLGNVCGILSKQEGVATGIGTYSNFAGIFHPFWRGGITMEYYSHRKQRIPRGENAGVVTFDKVEGDLKKPEGYGGSYQDQKPPRLPKMFKED